VPATTVEIPDTPVGKQLRWALDVFDEPGSVEVNDVQKRFTAAFLSQVPPEMFLQLRQRLVTMLQGFALVRFEGEPTPTALVAVLETPDGSAYRLNVAVQPRAPHRIAGMLIQPAMDLRREPPAKSWRELDDKLGPLASRVAFLAAEVVGDELVRVHDIEPERSLAIGSAFKLYVLGALAFQIEAGTVSWDEELPVRAALRSIPSGVMQNEKLGRKFPVRHFAEKMISLSDNTATDHLIARIGRERVEAALAEMGHSDPARNVPFLTTREFTVLKVSRTNYAQHYIETDAPAQRKLLATVGRAKLPKITDPFGWPSPRFVETIEWFASPADLGRAMVWLRNAMSRPGLEPLRSILSANPGLPFDRYAWPYVGFKGGGEPGVLSMTWLLRRLDDRWFVLSCALNDDDRTPDVVQVSSLMLAAGALLVLQRRKTKGKALRHP